MLLVDAAHTRENLRFHQLFLLHGGELRRRRRLSFFFLFFFACFCGCTLLSTGTLLILALLYLVDTDPSDTLQLKPEVDLHDVLHGLMRLRDEHVEEQDPQEGATLLAR